LKNLSQPLAGYNGMYLLPQAIWEAEMGKIAVLGQPGQKGLQNPNTMGEKVRRGGIHCHPSDDEKLKIGRLSSRWSGPKARLYLKNNQSKKSWEHSSSGRAPI
jgi:hypothetical protein